MFLTLTAPGAVAHARPDGDLCRCTPVGGTDLAAWNLSAAARWNDFVRDLSRLLGLDYFVEVVREDGTVRRSRRNGLRYFRAAEVQRRGALHYHVLLRRVDGRPLVVQRKKIRRLAIRHGFGHSVDVQRLEDGHAAYAAKYVAKSADERRDVPWPAIRYDRPVGLARGFRVERSDGRIVDRRTGEVVGRAPGRLCHGPTFRTWSASRTWGAGMAEVKAAQQHWLLTVEDLPSWGTVPTDPAWGALFGVPRVRPAPTPADDVGTVC